MFNNWRFALVVWLACLTLIVYARALVPGEIGIYEAEDITALARIEEQLASTDLRSARLRNGER